MPDDKPTEPDFEEMLQKIGEFGTYQKILFFWQAPFCFFLAFVLFGQLFMTNPYPSQYWCTDPKVPGEFEKLSSEQLQKLSAPYSKSDDTYDQCKTYKTDGSPGPEETSTGSSTGNNSEPSKPSPQDCPSKGGNYNNETKLDREKFAEKKCPTTDCKDWGWDKKESPKKLTIVSDGNWLCDPEQKLAIAQGLFFVGAIVGAFLIGWVADKYGRVHALVLACNFGLVGGACTCISTNFYAFCAFRFLTGIAYDNCFSMIYILVLEYVGPSYRTLVANLSIAIFFTMGTVLLPWIAFGLQNWRYYGLAISLPMALAPLTYLVVPESARSKRGLVKWLLSQGKIKRAMKILRRFAKINRKRVSEETFVKFESDAQAAYDESKKDKNNDVSLLKGLKMSRIRKNFILLAIIWALIALVYDGHSRNVLNLGPNIYIMFTIASCTELPADLLVIVTLDRFGRRWLSFGSLFFSGLFSFASAFVPPNVEHLPLSMAMCSRFFVNIAFNIGLQYAAELLPTVIRAQGVNQIHMIGYLAAIISPFIAMIGRTRPVLSLIILGSLAICGGIISLFLPETLGEDMPNTLKDGQAFGKGQSFWNCPICSKKKEPKKPKDDESEDEGYKDKFMRPASRGEILKSRLISSKERVHDPKANAIPKSSKSKSRKAGNNNLNLSKDDQKRIKSAYAQGKKDSKIQAKEDKSKKGSEKDKNKDKDKKDKKDKEKEKKSKPKKDKEKKSRRKGTKKGQDTDLAGGKEKEKSKTGLDNKDKEVKKDEKPAETPKKETPKPSEQKPPPSKPSKPQNQTQQRVKPNQVKPKPRPNQTQNRPRPSGSPSQRPSQRPR